jgi:uncharacterized membrane protein
LLFFPQKLLAFARHVEQQASLWAAGAFRVLFGLALFLPAPPTSDDATSILVPLMVIITVTDFVGIKRVHKLLDRWESRGPLYTRIGAGTALTLGLLSALAVVWLPDQN